MKFRFFYGGCWGLAQNKERAFRAIRIGWKTGEKLNSASSCGFGKTYPPLKQKSSERITVIGLVFIVYLICSKSRNFVSRKHLLSFIDFNWKVYACFFLSLQSIYSNHPSSWIYERLTAISRMNRSVCLKILCFISFKSPYLMWNDSRGHGFKQFLLKWRSDSYHRITCLCYGRITRTK